MTTRTASLGALVGTRWIRNSDLPSQGWELRVMAQAEGHLMVRFKGSLPFVLSIKELRKDYVPKGAEKGDL